MCDVKSPGETKATCFSTSTNERAPQQRDLALWWEAAKPDRIKIFSSKKRRMFAHSLLTQLNWFSRGFLPHLSLVDKTRSLEFCNDFRKEAKREPTSAGPAGVQESRNVTWFPVHFESCGFVLFCSFGLFKQVCVCPVRWSKQFFGNHVSLVMQEMRRKHSLLFLNFDPGPAFVVQDPLQSH